MELTGEKKEKNQIFIQARTGSTRLPDKVLLKIKDKTILELIVERLSLVKDIDKIIIITTRKKRDDRIIKIAKKLGVNFFRGSENNVLDRFYQAKIKFQPDNIIRVTADCPLIDYNLINQGLKIFKKGDYDILSLSNYGEERTFPHGVDFDILKSSALKIAWHYFFRKLNKDKEKFDKVFINPIEYILKKKKFKKKILVNKKKLSYIRITLDYKEDFKLIKKIYENLYSKNKYFNLNEILKFLKNNSHLLNLNKKYVCLGKKLTIEK